LASFIAVLLLSVFFIPAQTVSAAVTVPDEAGVLEWFMEFFRSVFSAGPSAEKSGENESEGAFSKNPYVYIAAFWTEIANAPEERTFFERIMAFLEAVRVRRR
jgi:hypothetical protein